MSAQEVITATEVRVAQQQRTSLLETFAHKYGLEPKNMMRTLKATAFKGEVSDDQMAALLIVAKAHNLNPWLKEIYAFPSRQGIVPIVGVDGWARIINEHPQFNGMDFALSGETGKEAITCTIHRKDRSHPITVTEYMTECYRATDPWKSHPLRMLRHKAMIQCARLAFSFAGIYDPDEGERVLAAENAIDVTPGNEAIPDSTGKIAPKRLRAVIEGIDAAIKGSDAAALRKVWGELNSEQQLFVWGHMRSWDRSAFKKLEATNEYKIAASGLDLPAWAVELVRSCTEPPKLEEAWRTIQDLFAENDTEVPADVETVYVDRKTELGA